jgi:hypothetical protein
MTMLMSLVAFADSEATSDIQALYNAGQDISGYTSTDQNAYTDAVRVTINGTPYYYSEANSDSIKTIYSNYVTNQAASTADEQAVSDMRDITNGLNISANMTGAYGLLRGFTGIIQTLLGILVVLITVGTTIFTGFDVCYIVFPTFRNKCEDQKASGSGMFAGGTKTASGETKLRFISDEAQYAVNAAQTLETGKNPLIIYFSKRVIAYMVLAVVLFIFLTGRVTVFTDLALKVVSGILDIIQNAS